MIQKNINPILVSQNRCYFCKAIKFKRIPGCRYNLDCTKPICHCFQPIEQEDVSFRQERIKRVEELQKRTLIHKQEKQNRASHKKEYLFTIK